MTDLSLRRRVSIMLDVHEPETDIADKQLAAVLAAEPSGDPLFWPDRCGRLVAIATMYQGQLHLLSRRLRELTAEQQTITTACPVGDEIECPNCGGLGTDRPGTFSSYDFYLDHLCHVCLGEQVVSCICDEGPDPDCMVCDHA